MQSSYSLIKSNFAKAGESRVISTEYVRKTDEVQEEIEEVIEQEEVPKVDPEELLKKYEEIGQRIIKNAEEEKKNILLNAQVEATKSEKEAYEKGYAQGSKNGYDDAYKKAYEETINRAQAEAEEIVAKAENLLNSARDEYLSYLEEKKSQIIKLVFNIAENITRQTLNKDDSLNQLIEEAFKVSKGEDNVIIRANTIHVESLKNNINRWKVSYGIKNDIFVVADDIMESGNAILEKPSGIVKVGIDIGMEQIKKAILG